MVGSRLLQIKIFGYECKQKQISLTAVNQIFPNQVFPIFLQRRSVAIIILCYRSDFALRGRIRPIGGLPYKASILNHNRLNRFIGLVIGKSHRPGAILVFANASVIYLLYFEEALHWFECKENHVALKKVKVF